MTGFNKVMRFCNTLQDYESAKNQGTITDDLFVVILQDKLAKFKGQTFDWSQNADLTALATKGELEDLAEEIASNERVWAEALNDLNERINEIGTGGGGGGGTSDIVVDAALSTTSTNAIQNKAVANALNEKADASALASKQDTLVSGTNIKTVQGQSILGSGNISISVPTVDAALSSTSTNAVQNKVVKAELDEKANAGIISVLSKDIYGDTLLVTPCKEGVDILTSTRYPLAIKSGKISAKLLDYESVIDRNYMAIQFYDSSGNRIGNEQYVTEAGIEFTLEKDAVAYSFYCGGAAVVGTGFFYISLLGGNLNEGVDGKVSALAEVTYRNGTVQGYVSSDGTNAFWLYNKLYLSRFIKLYPGDVVRIKRNASYTSYYTFIEDYRTQDINFTYGSIFRGTDETHTVEKGCYLVVLYKYDTQDWTPEVLDVNGKSYIEIEAGANETYVEGLSSEVSNISDDLSEIKTQLEEVSQNNIINRVVNGNSVLKLSFADFTEDGYWAYSDTAVINKGYNYKSYPLVPLTSGKKIKFKGLTSTGSYLAAQIMYWYDNEYKPYNGTYGKIIPQQLKLDANGDCEVILPNNVGYVGFSWTSDYPSNFTIEMEGGWEFTDEAISKIQAACSIDSVSEVSLGSYYLKGNMEKKATTKKLCIIAGGQSNMNGTIPISEKPASISLPMNNCHYCYRNNSITSGGFVSLTEDKVSNWGVDLSLYNQLCNVDGREIYVIKQSLGGVGIDPEGNTGDLCWTADYELIPEAKSFIRGLEKQIRELRENEGENFEIAAFIWHQGEGDYKSPADARYYDNLRKVVAYVRGVVGNPVLPFIFGTISHKSAQFSAVVETAMNKIAAEDVNTQLIDMSEASLRDAYHFNASWADYMGKKMYDALIDLKVISGTKLNPTKPV